MQFSGDIWLFLLVQVISYSEKKKKRALVTADVAVVI
jgi:hypothetical protein